MTKIILMLQETGMMDPSMEILKDLKILTSKYHCEKGVDNESLVKNFPTISKRISLKSVLESVYI